MSALLVSMIALLQSGAPEAPDVRPWPRRDACTCAAESREAEISFSGVVIDAELRADPSGRTIEPRQATIFRVVRVVVGSVESPAKIWHTTDAKKCGVRFDYGQVYLVRARKAENELETDICLMPELGGAEPIQPDAPSPALENH
jgi:hypothetical protein